MEKRFEEFRQMELLDQLEIILMHGVLQAQSKTATERSFLYQLFEFFVTITYSEPGKELKSIICARTASEAMRQFQAPTEMTDPACRVQRVTEK
jgi:hypothetical protein